MGGRVRRLRKPRTQSRELKARLDKTQHKKAKAEYRKFNCQGERKPGWEGKRLSKQRPLQLGILTPSDADMEHPPYRGS